MYLEKFTSKISHFSFFLLVFQFSTFSQQHTFTSFSPSHVGTGYIVTLRGTNLTSVTGVNFGGTAASSFTIINTTTIRAVVGAGTTGSVSVLKTGFTTGAYTYIWETSTSISGPFIVIPGADENTYTPSLNVAATNYFRVKITSFSPFAISSRWGLGYISPLPVELLDFTAKCLEDNTVKIDWSTASETNSSYFEVRKSIDGYTWNTINTIPAAGNSTG